MSNFNIYKKAFSLIELLVVIALLMILISLLSPALNNVINQANLVKCGSNLRNVGGGLHILAGDHNSAFFDEDHLFEKKVNNFKYANPEMRRSFKGYPRMLEPYFTNLNELIYCPEDESEDAAKMSSKNGAHVSYEYKGVLISQARYNYKRALKEFDFSIPDRQSLLINRQTFHSQFQVGSGKSNLMIYHHNFYFVDGHIELYNTGYNRPNKPDSSISWQKYPERRNKDGSYLENMCEPEDNFY